MFTRILVPLDGSPESEEALDSAVTIALAANAALEIVWVRAPTIDRHQTLPMPKDEHVEPIYLRMMAKRALLVGQTKTRTTVLEGDPADAICAEAERLGVDLIVMTSHFRTGISRIWSGSVSDAVLRKSRLPVLMIRVQHRASTALLVAVRFRRILVTLDGSAAASAVLDSVSSLALCDRADVVLLYVMPSLPDTAESVAFGQIARKPASTEPADTVSQSSQQALSVANAHLDELAAQLRKSGVLNVSWFVTTADETEEGILAFADFHSIDLIAMTTHGSGRSRLVAGSVADAILRESKLPVLLLQPSLSLVDEPARDASNLFGDSERAGIVG